MTSESSRVYTGDSYLATAFQCELSDFEAEEEKAEQEMIASSAMNRLGQPDEIAKTALFLASESASFINGQVIRVDGGIV